MSRIIFLRRACEKLRKIREFEPTHVGCYVRIDEPDAARALSLTFLLGIDSGAMKRMIAIVITVRHSRSTTEHQMLQAWRMILGIFLGFYSMIGAASDPAPLAVVEMQLQKPIIPIPAVYNFYLKNGCIWQGLVQLHGQKWLLGAIELPNSNRRQPRRIWKFFLQAADKQGAPETNPPWQLSAIQNFTINDHAYRVNWAFTGAGANERIEITFVEYDPTWARLKVEGNDIRRLQLHGQQIFLIENPGSEVRLPQDSYTYNQVTVGKTNGNVWFETRMNQPLLITAVKTYLLRAGGPLTNLVTVSWSGRSAQLNYQLLGSQGHSYQSTDSSRPPRFTVSQNGKAIASGTFEYG